MNKTKKNLFSATHSVAKKGTVAMLCMILFGLISIAGCKKDEADCGEKEPEYPIETPFTEYSLPDNFQWADLAYNNSVVIINSEEELTHYVESTDGSYPIIDFSRHTLLLANGKADNGVSKISVTDLQQLSENNFELSVEILKKGIDILEPWTVALIVEKVNEESSVKLNLNLSDYPINIPFEKYSLFGTNCGWNLYPHLPPFPYDPYTIIINSNEELEEYISCRPDGKYPEIDFSKHSLLLAIGSVNKSISKLYMNGLQQLTVNKYVLNIEINLAEHPIGDIWLFSFIVGKLNDDSSVEINITYDHYPKKILFTEYYMYAKNPQDPCWDIYNSFFQAGGVKIINSDKELKKYFHCANDYPAIDFSQYTLLLAYGTVSSGYDKITGMYFEKIDTNLYNWHIQIGGGLTADGGYFCVAILTRKIEDEELVILVKRD